MARDHYITQAQLNDAVKVTWGQMNPSRITSVLREPHFSFRVQREAEAILAAMGVANPPRRCVPAAIGSRAPSTTSCSRSPTTRCAPGSTPWPTRTCTTALVAINSETGEIVAYVGSVDYYNRKDKRVQGQFDVAGLSLRQPGSAFKPIVYSSAFRAREATPATFFVDSVTQFGADRDTSYLPTNADIKDHGPLLAVDALRYSLNVPSVMMQCLVGVNETARFASRWASLRASTSSNQDPGLAGARIGAGQPDQHDRRLRRLRPAGVLNRQPPSWRSATGTTA